MQMDRLTLRRNTFRIQDEQHVIATRRHRMRVNAVRCNSTNRIGPGFREYALDRTLFGIGVMRTGRRSHQYYLGDLTRLLSLNDERCAVMDRRCALGRRHDSVDATNHRSRS